MVENRWTEEAATFGITSFCHGSDAPRLPLSSVNDLAVATGHDQGCQRRSDWGQSKVRDSVSESCQKVRVLNGVKLYLPCDPCSGLVLLCCYKHAGSLDNSTVRPWANVASCRKAVRCAHGDSRPLMTRRKDCRCAPHKAVANRARSQFNVGLLQVLGGTSAQ